MTSPLSRCCRWIVVLALAVTPTAALAKDHLTIAISGSGYTFLPPMIAIVLGYLDDEGIEPELMSMGGGAKALAAMAAGAAQVYVGAPSSALRARERGIDTIVIGADISEYALDLVVTDVWAKKKNVTAMSPYADKLAALRGATVAITSPGSATDQIMQYLAKQAGLSVDKDLTLTPLGDQNPALAAFSLNRVDGLIFAQPAGRVATHNMNGVMLFDGSHGGIKGLEGFLYMGLIVRQSWAEKNPELAVRFLRAVQRGLDALHDDVLTLKARDLVHARYEPKVDKAEYDDLWQSMRGAFPVSVALDERMIRRNANFLAEFDRKPVAAETLRDGWTNSYAEQALKTARR
jgi:NitT/TauT family transport system substrate-binding protein